MSASQSSCDSSPISPPLTGRSIKSSTPGNSSFLRLTAKKEELGLMYVCECVCMCVCVCVCVCVCDCVCMLTLPDPRFIHLLLLGLYYFLYTWPVLRVEPGLHPARRHIPRILQALRKPTRSCALSHFPLYNWHSRHIGQVFWTPKLTQFIADMLSGMN